MHFSICTIKTQHCIKDNFLWSCKQKPKGCKLKLGLLQYELSLVHGVHTLPGERCSVCLTGMIMDLVEKFVRVVLFCSMSRIKTSQAIYSFVGDLSVQYVSLQAKLQHRSEAGKILIVQENTVCSR